MNRLLPLFFALALVVTSLKASGLNPGDQLIVTFTASSNTADILLFFSNDPLTVTGAPVFTTSLYNGQTLLGTYVAKPFVFNGVSAYIAAFVSPGGGSGVSLYSPTKVDFSSINNGTIDGRLVITISGGSVSGFNQANFILYDASSVTNGYFPLSNITRTNLTLKSALAIPHAVGVYRNGVWIVDWNGNNQWDATDAAHVFPFGVPGDLPVVGDWNGDGRLKAGVFRNGVWIVDWNGNNQWDATDAARAFPFGAPGDLPVVGDWNGDGRLKAGVFRNGVWIVDWNGNNQWDATDAAHVFFFGAPGDLPVVGDWNGDGRLKAGVFRNGVWIVDWNGNNQWDATDAAQVFPFGAPGDLPVVGRWDSSQQSISSLDAPPAISQLETAVTEDQPQQQSLWQSTSLLLNGNAKLRAAVEKMEREQSAIMVDPELRRQLSDMQSDVAKIESRPEVQDHLRRMRIEMERIREQFPPE